jgi:hypothetical protein
MRFTGVRFFTLVLAWLLAAVGIAAGQGAQPASNQANVPRQLFSIDHSLLTFGEVPAGSTSTVHTVKITSADKSLVNIHSSVGGEDYRLEPSDCKVDAVTTCILSVTFAPQHLYTSEATITITGTSADGAFSSNRTVDLEGACTGRCNAGEDFFTKPWFIDFAPALLIVACFLIGILMVRWNMVARPNMQLLRAQIEGVRAEIDTLSPTPLTPQILPQITALLAQAEAPFAAPRRWRDRIADYFFWTRGEEISAWVRVHEAEELMVDLLPDERVRARMERAEQELRRINAPPATGLADEVRDALAPVAAGAPPVPPTRGRALLHEALSLIYDKSDRDFTAFMSWQNKAVWLIGCGLLFILSLTAALQHGVLLLVGGVGGLLSRLSRSLQRADVPTDYGASWTTLFLSPVVGALMGWAGVLLVTIGVKLGVLGSAFDKVDWCNPWGAFTLGIAFLMGFSERAFNGILTQLEEKTSAQAKSAQATTTTSPTKGGGGAGAGAGPGAGAGGAAPGAGPGAGAAGAGQAGDT